MKPVRIYLYLQEVRGVRGGSKGTRLRRSDGKLVLMDRKRLNDLSAQQRVISLSDFNFDGERQ